MTSTQFRMLCEGIQQVNSGADMLTHLAKGLTDSEKNEAMKILTFTEIILKAAVQFHKAANDFIIDKS